jgi:transcriptional regulator with XRE-family HTH domain
MNDYVKRLRPWRLEHKISVRKMAKMLGLSASYYWMLETGYRGRYKGTAWALRTRIEGVIMSEDLGNGTH